MKINQALVVYKDIFKKVGARPKKMVQDEHVATIEAVYSTLKKRGIAFTSISTTQLGDIEGVDIVITVGGDGTVLATSHFTTNIPILAVKSFKESVGHFCAATKADLERYIDGITKGTLRPIWLSRLKIRIDGKELKELALNDVLFAHASPASTTRYRIRIGKTAEVQRSSGVWIASAAGSSAAISAAGGRRLPLTSRRIQYLVREPYPSRSSYRLTKGVLKEGNGISITSLIEHGVVYIDGSHIQYPALPGTTVEIRGDGAPLKIYWKPRRLF